VLPSAKFRLSSRFAPNTRRSILDLAATLRRSSPLADRACRRWASLALEPPTFCTGGRASKARESPSQIPAPPCLVWLGPERCSPVRPSAQAQSEPHGIQATSTALLLAGFRSRLGYQRSALCACLFPVARHGLPDVPCHEIRFLITGHER